VITEEDFVRMVGELALPTGGIELTGSLNREALMGWNSLHMLKLAAAVEKRTGRRVTVGRLMGDKSLGGIYDVLTAA